MKNPTAIIYARVSSAGQAEEGLPIESQVEQAKTKAASLGADVVKILVDDGISGRTDRRPAFQQAMDLCAMGDVSYLIVWNSSRFARNKIDAALYKRDLKRYNTRLIYVSCTINDETDEGWLTDGLFELFDEHQSRMISKDTKRSMMKNARDGFYNGGYPPFGYTIVQDGKRKKLQINPVESGIVTEIFRMYLGGSGAKDITMRLNEMGILRRGKKWCKNTVANMLKSSIYTGHLTFNRRDRTNGGFKPEAEWIVVPSHTPIISAEDFERTQQMFKDRTPARDKGSPHSRYAFTGLVKCAACGSGMHIESATGRSATYHYYNCRSALKGSGCGNRRIKAELLDEWLIHSILDSIFTRDRMMQMARDVRELTGEWEKTRVAQVDQLENDLRATERKLSKLFEILEETGKDTPNLGDLTARLRMHKDNKGRLEKELSALAAKIQPEVEITEQEVNEVTEFCRGIILGSTDVKRLRLFFTTFIKQIDIHDDHVMIEYYPERLVNRKGFEVVQGKGQEWLPDLALPRTAKITVLLPDRMRRAA